MIERADSNGDGQITPEAELLVTHLLTLLALDVHLAEAVSYLFHVSHEFNPRIELTSGCAFGGLKDFYNIMTKKTFP